MSKKKKENRNPLLLEPAGPSEKRNWWCNTHFGTTNAVLCEICGTPHECQDNEISSSYHLFELFGRQGVSECCGKLIDDLYEEWGDDFCNQYLTDFAHNPLMDGSLLYHLEAVIKEALEKATELKDSVCDDIKRLNAITSAQKAENDEKR